MPPLDRRRRSRRRSSGPLVIGLLAAAIVLFVLIGGILAIGHGSGPYHQSVNHSFAAQASVLVDQSNAQAAMLRSVVNDMPNLDRTTLQFDLDALASATREQAAAMHALAPPSPESDTATELTTVFDQRADAVAAIRTAVFGFLGITDSPTVSNDQGASSTTQGTAPALLDETRVAQILAQAGTSLTRADQSYASARRGLAAATGHARLPVSVWVPNAALWSIGSVQTQVDLVGGSVTLSQLHCLQLASVRIVPGALPPPTPTPPTSTTSAPTTTTSTSTTTTSTSTTTTSPNTSTSSSTTTSTTKPKKKVQRPQPPTCGTANGLAPTSTSTATLPPTRGLSVTAVVTNAGNVIEPSVVVQFSLEAQTTGTTQTVVRHLALAPNQSVTLNPVLLAVKPNQVYVLTVSVTPPPAQTVQSDLSRSYALQVAPATPPTTVPPTTTTTAKPS